MPLQFKRLKNVISTEASLRIRTIFKLRSFFQKQLSPLRLSQLTILAILFTACSAPPQPTATLATDAPPSTATADAPLVLLVAPPQADAALVATADELVSAYAVQQQLRFEQRQLLDSTQLPAGLSMLVLLAPDPGAAALAAAAPQARVITIGFVPEGQFSNLVSLPFDNSGADSAAFIAGYVAALTAEDWRAGILYTPASANLVNAFVAGAEYFCGACIPIAPPEADLPLVVQAGDAANWQAAAEQLLASNARVVYLTPELETSGAGQYLASFGLLLIGTGAPPADLAASWLASVLVDQLVLLRQRLPLAFAGQPFDDGGGLLLSQVNSAYLGEGRLADIQQVIDDLRSGFIVLPASE